MESTLLRYRVDPAEIHYLRFITEAYDGLAMLRTEDPRQGIVTLLVPPGCLEDALALMEDLSRELFIQPVSDDGVLDR
ncbi:MAG: DUF4911 domain-containing protein [Desulfatibacillaceae bacterium]